MISAAILCLVVGVSDGDTLKVRCGDAGHYQQVTLRLSAVDAPEKAQPFGQRSKQALSDLCFQQQATIKVCDTDRYGRRVADVACRGKDAGACSDARDDRPGTAAHPRVPGRVAADRPEAVSLGNYGLAPARSCTQSRCADQRAGH